MEEEYHLNSLGDRQRQKALIPFLDASDELSGVLTTFAFRKSIKDLYTDKELFKLLQNTWDFKSKWKQKSFENMVRVAHLVGLLIGGLSRPNQNIYWISDEDKLFAKFKAKHKTCNKCLENSLVCM